jgi:hypothetical protein
MKECPVCHKVYPDPNRFCSIDGSKLEETIQQTGDLDDSKEHRLVPPPSDPLPMRLTIVDQNDEGHRSRCIEGVVLDTGRQGLRIRTGTVNTGQLSIIRDHTIAFKNKLELEVDLPEKTINLNGFAAWYKQADDGLNWNVGVYIRDMTSEDRRAYDHYLETLTRNSDVEQATTSG